MSRSRRYAGRVAPVVACAFAIGCAATQPVRVLHQGETRIIGSLGGPLLPHHVPTGFVPYTNVGMLRGVSENVTLSANVHLLAAAFGIGGVDAGIAKRLRAQDGSVPEVTGQAQAYLFAGSGGARFYPNVSGTASWTVGDRSLAYAGAALTGQLSGGRGVLASPYLGYQQDVGRRVTLQLEGKWMAANVDMSRGLFEGENSVGGHGGLALQLGVQVKR